VSRLRPGKRRIPPTTADRRRSRCAVPPASLRLRSRPGTAYARRATAPPARPPPDRTVRACAAPTNENLTVRMIMSNGQVGTIIGKGGVTIKVGARHLA